MNLELNETGDLDKALELVKSELPPGLPDEEQARLAVEIYRSRILASSLSRIASSIEGLTMTLETFGSRNSG